MSLQLLPDSDAFILQFEMHYLLFMVAFVVGRAEIWLSHFSAGPSASAIHQVNSNTLVVGTREGHLLSCTPKGQYIKEQQQPHRTTITSIHSSCNNDSCLIVAADKQGMLSFWNQDLELKEVINKSREILEIVISNNNSGPLLAVNMGNQIDFHDLVSLELVRSVCKETYIFKKILFGQQNLYLQAENQQKSSLWAYNTIDDVLDLIMQRQSKILDFSISASNYSHHLFIINNLKRLQMYELDGNYSVIDSLKQQESHLMPSSYSSLTYFQNTERLPLFVMVKASQQLQFFNGFSVTLFLQLNSEVKVVHSTINSSLLLLSANGQVTSILVGEAEDDQNIDLWIIILILLLLALGLYLCCGDCWPGLIQKWRLQQERKEIELQLYRQRTDLENF